MLKNGNKQAQGGKREGSGRKPSWVRERAQQITEDAGVLEFLGRVVQGIEKDHRAITRHGSGKIDIVEVPASIHDKIDASRELLDRAFGRPMQMMELSEDQAFPFMVIRPDDTIRKAA